MVLVEESVGHLYILIVLGIKNKYCRNKEKCNEKEETLNITFLQMKTLHHKPVDWMMK